MKKRNNKKKSAFRGSVNRNAKKIKSNKGFGYITLPKDVKMFNADPGETELFDVLPYEVTDKKHPDLDVDNGDAEKGSLWWKRPFTTHRNVGTEEQTYVCPKSIGKPCPICEDLRKQLDDDGAEWDDVKEMMAKTRGLYVVAPQEGKEAGEIHVMDMSTYLFQDLLLDEVDANPDYEIFPDLEEGLTLQVRWKSKTFGKNSKPYAEAASIKFEERDEEYDEDILEDIPSLDDLLQIKSYDELSALYFELDPGEDDDDDDDEEERPRKKKSLKKKKKVVVEDDDDDDDEDEKPKKKKKKLTRKKKKDEDEEDDASDEEDDLPFLEDDEKYCIACRNNDGIGLSSKGRKCRPCDGTGVVEKDNDDEEDEKPKKKKSSKNKCPYDYKFGVHTDKKPECDDCKVWDDCSDAKEENA